MAGYNTITPEYFITYMQQKGWSFEQAAGLANNIKHESNFGYDRFQGDKVVPLYTKDTGYGLAQWTNKERKLKFAELFGIELTQSTPEQQMDFLNWELRNTEKKAGDLLARTTTVEDASRVVTTQFERPANAAAQAEKRVSSLDWLRDKVGGVMKGTAGMLPNDGIVGQFRNIMMGAGLLIDSDNSNANAPIALSDVPVVGQYWMTGIIIVASIGLIIAGGLLKGGSPVKLASDLAKGK